MQNLTSLVQNAHKVEKSIEATRKNNKCVYFKLLEQNEWESITQLANATGLHIATVHAIVHKLADEGLVELREEVFRSGKEGRFVRLRIIVNESKIFRYKELWSRYRKLDGLFKSDVVPLLKELPLSYLGKLLGYSGNSTRRNSSLRCALKKLGWLEGQ